ncbi:unnamed protein product [Dracunculus medinensis]|uniref:Conserved oligomeric Golgi complex subunit 6 n=1 Tax=Dracunculus medinensis TaxID=318479 RepID=A0A158Q5R0_DRAME|nr:unnamed protein product [Dracunculus medinensis]
MLRRTDGKSEENRSGDINTNPIKKKVDSLLSSNFHTDQHYVLDINIILQNFLGMMDYVASMIGEIDLHTERRLMIKLEKEKLRVYHKYLNDFEKVNNSVQSFAGKVHELNKICADMTNRIRSNKEKTQDLLSKTTALQTEKKLLEKKKQAVDDFFERFSLLPEEEKALQGSELDGTIDNNFFTALQRIKTIQIDSKQLLRSSGENLAALEIMEDMAKKLEQAYEVLYRSVQRECRLLNMDFMEMKSVLLQSMATLQDRPVLFKYAIDEYATARRNHIVRLYIDALTRGGSSGVPKPIELLSHDSLRYIGDMLAWIHQSLATERELLQVLLKLCKAEVLEENSMSILSEISEAMCRPFKVRVEQALSNESNCIVLYRLSCLFTFYGDTIRRTLCKEAVLSLTIDELRALALDMFFSGLKSAVQKFLSKINTPDYDLLPVHAAHQVLMLLKDVLESHDSVVAVVVDKKENFEKIFAAVLDPLNQAIQISATQLHSPLDIAVYTLNCLSAINSLIILYQYTDSRLEMIKAQITANEDVLVSEQVTMILNQTDLMEIYKKSCAHRSNQGALSEISGMEPSRISSAFALFDAFLANPDNFSLDQFSKISSARIRESVQQRTIDDLIAAYNVIYNKIIDESNKYPPMHLKPIEQIKELLQGWK